VRDRWYWYADQSGQVIPKCNIIDGVYELLYN
jgi:hypothetical protein